MATEEGVVVRRDPSGTWVKTVRTGACESCSSRGACHSLGGGGKEAEVSVLDPLGAEVGDRVVLRMDTAPLLKATFLVYLVPVLLLLFGAAAGHFLARAAGLDTSLPSALLGFASLGAGLLIVRKVGRRLSEKAAYRPRIARVIGRAAFLENDPAPSEPGLQKNAD